MSDSGGSADGFYRRMTTNPLFRSFLLFSLFRAVYGAGILVVTWFLASETEAPLWTSILFFLCSMVFSRVLFRFLKKAGKGQENEDVDQMLG
ncbi:MAG: hypothetical protein QMC59_05735 [Candidatus Poseidoniaceae archaeon]|jgi:hypothetical protein|tara:strand:- start:541 stop:816 length:276 start_codon:yes stop_codon:yes gene_type:complete